MKVELRNVSVNRALSEETECFSATVFIDGQKAGTVGNRGHGACNDYQPWSLQERLTEYAKTLPLVPWGDIGSPDGSKGFQPDADTVIGDALNAQQESKRLARMLGTHVVGLKGGKIYSFKLRAGAPKPIEALKHGTTRTKLGCDVFLNELPFDEALALFLKHAA